MARVCDICEKRTRVGGSIARRGLAKSKGGVGLKTTGHTKRKFFPNLQKHADDLCLLNGMTTDSPAHPTATIQLHTGSFTFVRRWWCSTGCRVTPTTVS